MAPVPDYSNSSSPLSEIRPTQNAKIPLGEYFFRRVKSLEVSSCFTVPGDYNLFFLDHSYNVSGMNLRNCCNELNTAYAADGYARASNKFGVAITTFGVGELSAMNGLSGAMAEFVPVLHVVGTTPRSVKAKQDNHTHHLITPIDLLQQSDHHIYEKMAGMISCCVESIENLEDAPNQIDNVLKQILIHKRPGYLYIPCDLANSLVDSSNLTKYQSQDFYQIQDPNPTYTSECVELILSKIYASQNPAIVGDVLIDRFQLTSEMRQIVNHTQFNNYTTPMGKSILDESEDSFVGSYWGKESHPLVQQSLLESDLILHFGGYHNEINSGHYTMYQNMDAEKLIYISDKFIRIGSQVFENTSLVPIIKGILEKLDSKRCPQSLKISAEIKTQISTIIDSPTPSDISQTYVLQKLSQFIQPGDHVVCETGSFMFGIPDVRFPTNCRYFGQNFYLSIGYALPATLGVGCAMKDAGDNSRLILFEGDGAAQMTIQEFANYMHQDIKPIIFLLNNNGYTVERIINGPELSYNDIMPNWQWTKIFNIFGDHDNSKSQGTRVETRKQLDLLIKSSMIQNDKINIIEVILDKFDVPWRFNFMTGASKE